jgi:ribosomal protein L40E
MLANASAIGSSLISPFVIAGAIVDTILLVVILRFGMAIGRDITERSPVPALGKIVSLATIVLVLLIGYRQYEIPTACLVVSPSDLVKVGQPSVPLNPDKVVPGLSQLFQGIAAAETKMVTGATLAAFQSAAVMLLRQPPDIYGWTFILLVALPVIGLVVLISRNLDAYTELVFLAASSSGPPVLPASVGGARALDQCSNCGHPIPARAKFCPNCGAAASALASISSARKVCASCGADNPTAARFCKECGKAA